jgi:hypothetical protein
MPHSATSVRSSSHLRLLGLSASALSFLISQNLHATSIVEGDVTTTLGPTFFLDDTTLGGSDTDIIQPGGLSAIRLFNGQLTPNQGPTRILITGIGFATHTSATANSATSITATITYLGSNESVGGGDDITIGSATGTFTFSGGKEYVFAFDAPLSADLTITGTRFRVQLAPSNPTGNGSLKLKTGTLTSDPTVSSAKISVAGIATPLINPQRLNLAKFQTVTTSSFAGQRLASYLTDGVVGNDNRWQSANSAWSNARIDFPFPVEVGSAQIFTGIDDTLPVTAFNIQYLNGTTWTTIPGGSVSGNTNVERNLIFTTPITASSFRIIGPDSPIRIRELALYPPNGPGGFPLGTDLTLNLAYQRPAVSSSNTSGNFALKAVDGRAHVGSFWQTNTPGTNTLEIDLRVTTRIGSAHLYSGTSGTSPLGAFTLKYWDGTAWQDISGATITGNTNPDLVIPFTPISTSRVRLEFENTTTTSIRELCIFPANSGNVGYPLGTNIISSGAIASYETYNDAFYLINNPSSGRRMSVPDNGQPSLDQPNLSFGQSQYQLLLNLSNGTYRLRNRATGNCLSGARLDKTPGLPLVDAPYSALPDQDWILDPLGGQTFRFINPWSGLVIDSQNGSTTPATPLVQNTPNTSPSQRWQPSYYAIHPKKGIGGTTFAMSTNPNWAYNWGRRNTNPLPQNTIFHPMQWGNFSWDIGSNQGPIWQEYPAWRTRADGIHLLGFNEPDRTDQSNISLATVINLWPRLQELDLPLTSPSPGTIGGDGGWLDSFYSQADALGYRVDYTAVHAYPGPSSGSSNNLVNFVTSAYTYHSKNRPVWLTEFSFVDWGGNQSWSEEDNYNCLAEFLWRAENLTALRKYSLFVFTESAEHPQPPNAWQDVTPAPRSNSLDINGNLTAFGKLYAAWDGDTTVRTNKTYHIHHKESRKRIANLTTQSNLAGRNIRIDGNLVNWTLVSAGSSNRYYLVSALDGRRLSSNGTTVSLAAPGTTGTATEWSLTESQHGWHYIGHPSSSKRLRLVYNNSNFVATYSLVANTSTGDDVQWRFIVPLPPPNTAPTLATIPPQTVDENSLLTFTASATDADLPANTLTFSLINPPSGATIAPSTGIFTWTPTPAQAPGLFNFSVRVSDGTLTHDQPVSITVEKSLPSPTADSDNDGLSDLLEYAFATDPETPNANPFRATESLASTTTLEFPWNWQATGITWQIRHGQDLSNISAWPVVAPGTITTQRDGNIDRITISPAQTYPDRGFYILEVIAN